MKPCTFLKMGRIGSKPRSLGQIIEDPMLVTKGLCFKYLLLNSIPHNPESSGERLQGNHGPLVYFFLENNSHICNVQFVICKITAFIWSCQKFCRLVKS